MKSKKITPAVDMIVKVEESAHSNNNGNSDY